MAGMDQGVMALAATISISEAPVKGHAIPIMRIEVTQDHRRLPMPYPLLPSLEFLTRNLNPISPSLRPQVYPASYNIIFKNLETIINPFMQAAWNY